MNTRRVTILTEEIAGDKRDMLRKMLETEEGE